MKHWYIFHHGSLLLTRHADATHSVPVGETPPVALPDNVVAHRVHPIGDTSEVYAIDLDQKPQAEGCVLVGLRESYRLLPTHEYLVAGKCEEILHWDRETQYCGTCGAPMRLSTDISKVCTRCGREVWPLLATAIIVLIHRGDEVLLVKARNFRRDFYGLVAGFVETGETLEEAVHREVSEETGLTIDNVQYFASQPWPYPRGLMVGFNARYVSGSLHLQEEELKTAAWFSRDNLPTIPEKLSMARQLIDNWLEHR